VKRTSFFVSLLFVAVVLLSTSCGTGDKIGSVSMTVGGTTGTVNLAGLGGTLQLQVNANYTSGKFIDETNFATFAITPEGYVQNYDSGGNPSTQSAMPTPPLGITIDKTGLVTAVDPGLCTWVNLGTLATPGWAYTGYYKIVATYRGFSSNPVFIPLASAASGQNNTNGQCGPS
jgi:hypothetical protein